MTVHVSFLEKLSNVAHRRRRGGSEQFAKNARVCGARRDAITVRARVRREVKVEYFVPTPRSIGVHESPL